MGRQTIPSLLWTTGVFLTILFLWVFLQPMPFSLMHAQISRQSLKQTHSWLPELFFLCSSFLCGTMLHKFYLSWLSWIMISASSFQRYCLTLLLPWNCLHEVTCWMLRFYCLFSFSQRSQYYNASVLMSISHCFLILYCFPVVHNRKGDGGAKSILSHSILAWSKSVCGYADRAWRWFLVPNILLLKTK